MAKSEKSNFFISKARDKPSSRINVLTNTFNSARQIVTTFRHRGCGSVVRKWWRLSGMHHRINRLLILQHEKLATLRTAGKDEQCLLPTCRSMFKRLGVITSS